MPRGAKQRQRRLIATTDEIRAAKKEAVIRHGFAVSMFQRQPDIFNVILGCLRANYSFAKTAEIVAAMGHRVSEAGMRKVYKNHFEHLFEEVKPEPRAKRILNETELEDAEVREHRRLARLSDETYHRLARVGGLDSV